jgi:hypothetical protein
LRGLEAGAAQARVCVDPEAVTPVPDAATAMPSGSVAPAGVEASGAR